MTNRQIAALETRKKLLEAGKKIICKKGLDGTSVEEITEAAGVAKGTFYTYFRRKEDIVFELSRGMFGKILEHARNLQGSFMEKLTDYMVNFSSYIEKSGARLSQDWVKSVVAPPEREPSDRGKLAEDLKDAEELIRDGISSGALKRDTPAEELAHTLMDLLYGQMLCWSMSDGSYSLKERTEEFCAGYLNGLLGNCMTGEEERK
jgi:TetR/AcrR family fatty acid metabolism transcriptional regulator